MACLPFWEKHAGMMSLYETPHLKHEAWANIFPNTQAHFRHREKASDHSSIINSLSEKIENDLLLYTWQATSVKSINFIAQKVPI